MQSLTWSAWISWGATCDRGGFLVLAHYCSLTGLVTLDYRQSKFICTRSVDILR